MVPVSPLLVLNLPFANCKGSFEALLDISKHLFMYLSCLFVEKIKWLYPKKY